MPLACAENEEFIKPYDAVLPEFHSRKPVHNVYALFQLGTLEKGLRDPYTEEDIPNVIVCGWHLSHLMSARNLKDRHFSTRPERIDGLVYGAFVIQAKRCDFPSETVSVFSAELIMPDPKFIVQPNRYYFSQQGMTEYLPNSFKRLQGLLEKQPHGSR